MVNNGLSKRETTVETPTPIIKPMKKIKVIYSCEGEDIIDVNVDSDFDYINDRVNDLATQDLGVSWEEVQEGANLDEQKK